MKTRWEFCKINGFDLGLIIHPFNLNGFNVTLSFGKYQLRYMKKWSKGFKYTDYVKQQEDYDRKFK